MASSLTSDTCRKIRDSLSLVDAIYYVAMVTNFKAYSLMGDYHHVDCYGRDMIGSDGLFEIIVKFDTGNIIMSITSSQGDTFKAKFVLCDPTSGKPQKYCYGDPVYVR